MHKIETSDAPKAVGPYSQALSVSVSNTQLIYVSGQLPLDPTTGKLNDADIEEATTQVLNNIEAILKAGNSSLDAVVRVEIFLKDLNDFQKVNDVYKTRFTHDPLPARQTIQVAKLPMDAAIEISCIAVAPAPKFS